MKFGELVGENVVTFDVIEEHSFSEFGCVDERGRVLGISQLT